MKNISIFGILMLCLGLGIGWLIKPTVSPESASATAPYNAPRPNAASVSKAEVDLQTRGKHSKRDTITKKTTINDDDKKQMQVDAIRAIIKTRRSQLDHYLQRRGDALNLSADQKAKMTAWMDEIMKKIEAIDANDPNSMSEIVNLMYEISTEPFDKELANILSDDQTSELAAVTEKERQTTIDSLALKSLAKLQGVVTLEESQRDEVYKILTAAAEKKILNGNKDAFGSGMQVSGIDIDMDPYDLGLMQAITEHQARPGQPTKTMQEIIDERIEAKVNDLRPVLNAKQLEQYRAELKSKGAGHLSNTIINPNTEGAISTSIPISGGAVGVSIFGSEGK